MKTPTARKSVLSMLAGLMLVATTVGTNPVAADDRLRGGRSRAMSRPSQDTRLAAEAVVSGILAMDVSLTEDQTSAHAGEWGDGLREAFGVVVQFLDLGDDQAEQLAALLRRRAETVQPLLQSIAEHQHRIRVLLERGGEPVIIGQLLTEIFALQRQIGRVQGEFFTSVVALLEPAQAEKLNLVHVAARLQPILPAFGALGLLRP